MEQTERALKTLRRLGVGRATIIGHDLGGILLQQLVQRTIEDPATLEIEHAVFSNSSVYAELYRPTLAQQALVDPVNGKLLARKITRATLEASLAPMFPKHPLQTSRIDDLWTAISLNNGQHLWPQQMIYMAERADLGATWIEAMHRTSMPLSFIYGLADPISGAQILSHAEIDLPFARCIGLSGLGHYPHIEAASEFSAALRLILPQAFRDA